MKFSKKHVGEIGENLGVKYLVSAGYEILERNWRFSRAEIDIIAKVEEILIFVEVKTRSYNYYGEPSDAIGEHKERMIMDAAQRYMEEIGHEWEIRFDIISVILSGSGGCEKLEHYKDAFF